MTRTPKIPMLPTELPQQRVCAVISLPQRPSGFHGIRVPPETVPPPAVLPPVKMPRAAKYIGQVEWAWGPNNTRLDAYYLSTNRKRTHWFLWLQWFDDNWGKWEEPQIHAYAAKQRVPSNVAAAFLLLDAWTEETRESDPGHFHWINNSALLSVEELQAIGRIVWPKSETP